MQLENIIIDIKILETGEQISLDLIFIRGDSEEEIDKLFDKIRAQMDEAVKGRNYKLLRMVRNTQTLNQFLN